MTTKPQPTPLPEAFQAMIAMAPDQIVIMTGDGEVQFANRALPACAHEALLGHKDALQKVLAVDAPVEFELELQDKEGTQRWFQVWMRRIEWSDQFRVLLFVRDVGEQRRAERELRETAEALKRSRRQMQQAQKLESVGRLAGGVAHDFNNLLTSIISFSRFVLDDLAPGDPRRDDLVEVLRAADSASKLTRQLLAFSRQRKVEPTILELNEALQNIDRVLRRTVEEKIELVLLPCEEPLNVSIGPGQLDQVMMNLAVNARDAMPDGGTFTVALSKQRVNGHPDMAGGDYCVISVTDTGIGMAPEVANQVFEPFFSTKGDRGTGLGLSTVYGIVKQADGHVELASEVGRGTTFTLWLPLKEAVARPASCAPQQPETKLTGIALVVEDQPAILKTIIRSMSGVGFNVLHAHSAEEALALIDDLDPKIDLLVTDVMLPGLSGLRLTERLRERSPGLRVVLCSGYMGERGNSEVPRDERTVFLPKPFTGPQLVESAATLFA